MESPQFRVFRDEDLQWKACSSAQKKKQYTLLRFVKKFLKISLFLHPMNRKLKLWELDRVDEQTFHEQEKFPLIVVLNDIRSLNNIGSFFRTADAFNVEKIILCGITAQPPHRDIQKTALGATESVTWEYHASITDVVAQLQAANVCVCSIEQAEKTVELQQIKTLPEQRFALVFGNEVDGVDQAVIDQSNYIIEIPQFGTKHSLNVSVCAGIVLWEFAKRYIA